MNACCFKLGAHRPQRSLLPGLHHPCPTGSARPTAQGRSEDLAVTRLCAPCAFKAKMSHSGICSDSVTFLTFRIGTPSSDVRTSQCNAALLQRRLGCRQLVSKQPQSAHIMPYASSMTAGCFYTIQKENQGESINTTTTLRHMEDVNLI